MSEAVVRTAFDQALENQALLEAAENYARQLGRRGSPEYRAAWLLFRGRIRTVGDLERWQTLQRIRGNGAGRRWATGSSSDSLRASPP